MLASVVARGVSDRPSCLSQLASKVILVTCDFFFGVNGEPPIPSHAGEVFLRRLKV